MDLATTAQTQSRRRTLRRAVRIEASLLSEGWDSTVPLVATDLSAEGLWIETDLPLELGEEVVVSLRPPRWIAEQPLRALAEVARVGLYRRQRETRKSGMGLRFKDLAHRDADFLSIALRGLPPPLPKRDPRQQVIEIERPCMDEVFGLPDVVLADGRRFVFRADGEFLTAGRGPAPMIASIAPQPTASVHRISSPMSAIFDRAATRTRLVGSVAC